jgi:hypothetical protein
MKVGEAQPGQILCAKGRIPRSYTKNLTQHELDTCFEAGFIPGFLMPAWIHQDPPPHAWPNKRQRDKDRLTPLFYIGPIWLKKLVGGLKKHHVFLYDGARIALEGYDFRHLEPLEGL